MNQVEKLIAEYQAISDRAKALVHRAGVARLNDKPANGGWSIAECFEHLNMTTRAFLPLWSEAYATLHARNLRSEGPYKIDFWGKILSWTLEPPNKFKMPTTPPFERPQPPPPDQVLRTFLDLQDAVILALNKGRGLALDQAKVRSPFQQRMQYSVWSSFVIGAAHARRHMSQAEKLAS